MDYVLSFDDLLLLKMSDDSGYRSDSSRDGVWM